MTWRSAGIEAAAAISRAERRAAQSALRKQLIVGQAAELAAVVRDQPKILRGRKTVARQRSPSSVPKINSALGFACSWDQSRHFAGLIPMSAFGGKADMRRALLNVR